jgi:proton-dependent oligopeptide transporter, POT family
VILGAALMAAGHFMMAFEAAGSTGTFRILGNGAFRPNISTQVGGLYAPGDHRATARVRSFTSASMSARS